MRKRALGAAFLCLGIGLSALDGGVYLAGVPEYDATGEGAAGIKTVLVPWLSAVFADERAEFFVSAGLLLNYAQGAAEPAAFVPELYRCDIQLYFDGGQVLRAGRLPFQDILGLIARGYFDGASFRFGAGGMRFSAGALYAGFQYRGSASITMTALDGTEASTALDYGRFAETYFAPARGFAFFRGEFPELFAARGELLAEILAQFDLRGEGALHSQYASARYRLRFGPLEGSLGLALEIVTEADGVLPAFAGTFQASWDLPTPFQDRLALGFRMGSGARDGLAAFSPLTATAQGSILKPKLSGIWLVQGDYSIRLFRTLQADLEAFCLFRAGTGFSDGEQDLLSTSPFLGPEFSGRLAWNPVMDVAASLAGGVFLPGPAFPAGTAPRWRLSLSVTLAL